MCRIRVVLTERSAQRPCAPTVSWVPSGPDVTSASTWRQVGVDAATRFRSRQFPPPWGYMAPSTSVSRAIRVTAITRSRQDKICARYTSGYVHQSLTCASCCTTRRPGLWHTALLEARTNNAVRCARCSGRGGWSLAIIGMRASRACVLHVRKSWGRIVLRGVPLSRGMP